MRRAVILHPPSGPWDGDTGRHSEPLLYGSARDGATRLAVGWRSQYSEGPRTVWWDCHRTVESEGGAAMPVYEYYCDNCRRDVSITLSISAHDNAKAACPQCGNTVLRPLVSTFFSQTSRKS
jgi:putative FmdB family regulatory protein